MVHWLVAFVAAGRRSGAALFVVREWKLALWGLNC